VGSPMSARHSRKPSTKAIILAGVLTVLAGVGAAIGADLWGGAKHIVGDDGSGGSSGSGQTLGTLSLAQLVRNYYPNNGALPSLPPPPYNHNDVQQREDHCGIWAGWATKVRAASDIPVMSLTTIAGSTSPITVLDMRAVVYARHPMANNVYLRCQYGAGGFTGTEAYVDLDHSYAPTPLDIDNDGQPDTTLPGGRFVVDPKNAESLYINLSGSAGVVYEYGIQLKVVENGREEARTFGSAEHPYRLAIRRPAEDQYLDWDAASGKWVTGDPDKEPK
jgi:hypothetical protein